MSKTTFNDLWVGDRFTAANGLWTKLDHRTARRHSPESIALGERGLGYVGDTICSFDKTDEVIFEAPDLASTREALLWALKQLDEEDRRESASCGHMAILHCASKGYKEARALLRNAASLSLAEKEKL